MSLTKHSIVVLTGAGSGIGRALAINLAKEGVAGLAISDVNESNLKETANLANKENAAVKISTHIVDVSKLEQMQGFVSEVLENHGRATHLINNAGVALFGMFDEISLEDMKWLMDINFWGVVYGTKLFLPVLQREKQAHITNISSVFGFIAPPGQTTYCASKFAVRGFTESLRHELNGSNVAVSCVHPGGIKTNIANAAKVGERANTSQRAELTKMFNEELTRTLPNDAAKTIIRGIKAKNPRILIGTDAKLISIGYRLFPKAYYRVLEFLSGGKLKKAGIGNQKLIGGEKV